MEKEKRALSWQEFVDSGFDGRDYEFPDFEGTFEATIACKRWNKSKNLLVYLDLDDGRKIITATWNKDNFFGLADMPVGSRVSVKFTPIIPKWKMELIAHEIFTKHFTDISAVTELACKMIEEHINDVEDVEGNTEIIAQKNAEIEKLERKKVGLIEMRADGDIERDYFLTRKDEVEKQIEHLQQEIQELTPIDTRQKKEDLVERLEALKQKLSEYTDFENTLIIPDGVIEAFTEQIIASDKGFDWYLKAVPDMVKSFMDNTPDDETEKEWHELTQFDLTIEDAKAYVYSFSSRRRVHGWQNIKIRLFV